VEKDVAYRLLASAITQAARLLVSCRRPKPRATADMKHMFHLFPRRKAAGYVTFVSQT